MNGRKCHRRQQGNSSGTSGAPSGDPGLGRPCGSRAPAGLRLRTVPSLTQVPGGFPLGEEPGPAARFGVITCVPCAFPRPHRSRTPRPPSARPGRPQRGGARTQTPPGRLPPRTPTCRPRMRSTLPARPASPRPAARGQCAGAAADASVYVRARRWRRRGKQREESDERRGSLKRVAMALRNPQVAGGPRPGREPPRAAAGGAGAGGRTLPGASVWEWGRAPGHAAPD